MLILNVNFSGSVQINANNITFQYIGTDESKKNYITGGEWNELTENEKSEYIIESMTNTIKECFDQSWTDIEVSVDDEV